MTRRQLAVIAIVLSFAAGATDAFAFLLLGGVFTANMTGNMVLVGLIERPDYLATLIGIVAALAGFVLVLYVVMRRTGEGTPAHRRPLALALGTTAQIGVFAGFAVLPQPLAPWTAALLLMLSAVAMGAQTAVSRRIQVHSGVSTTFVTGTITNIAADLADRIPQDLLARVGVVVGIVAGALCGSLAMLADPMWGAAVPVVPAAVATVLLLGFTRAASAGAAAPGR